MLIVYAAVACLLATVGNQYEMVAMVTDNTDLDWPDLIHRLNDTE